MTYFPRLSLFFMVLFLTACSSTPSSNVSNSAHKAQMQQVYKDWKGVPYRLGGTTKQGVDCSAFTQVAMYDVYQINLPRTTEQIATQGSKVSRSNAAYGDLVFFKTGWRTRHVGIYIGNNQFMHASTSKGVIISSLSNPYWNSKFWQVRRIL